jgi:hypothetical protein
VEEEKKGEGYKDIGPPIGEANEKGLTITQRAVLSAKNASD